MDIIFCDICNESVPESDLKAGKAVTRQGRVICALCEGSMTPPELLAKGSGAFGSGADQASHAAQGVAPNPVAGEAASFTSTAQPSPPGSLNYGLPSPAATQGVGGPMGAAAHSFGALPQASKQAGNRSSAASILAGLMAATALLVTGAGMVLVVERIQDVGREAAASREQLEQRLSSRQAMFEQRAASSREELGDALSLQLEARMQDEYQRGLALADKERADLRSRLANIEAGIAKFQLDMDALKLATKRDPVREGEWLAMKASLAELQRDVGTLASSMLSASQGAQQQVPQEPKETQPEWFPYAADLTDAVSGTRWNAVTVLGESRDERVVPYLIPVLRDEDIFVRMATARVLGEFSSAEAKSHSVGPLIDALSDSEAAVREAAVSALRNVTGMTFRFDPMAGESDRERRAKAWRDWWKKESRV